LKVIYISGAITAKTPYQRWLNARHSEEVMINLLKAGWAVICPHKNTENLDGSINRNLSTEHDFWIKMDLELLRRCDAIYMLRNYRHSVGSKAELKEAKKLGLDIYYEDGT